MPQRVSHWWRYEDDKVGSGKKQDKKVNKTSFQMHRKPKPLSPGLTHGRRRLKLQWSVGKAKDDPNPREKHVHSVSLIKLSPSVVSKTMHPSSFNPEDKGDNLLLPFSFGSDVLSGESSVKCNGMMFQLYICTWLNIPDKYLNNDWREHKYWAKRQRVLILGMSW